jgi:iron complex outermembrane receptor protein
VDSIATRLPTATYPRTYRNEGVYKATTPKFGVEYRANENVMFYASATRGFKSGGFNFASANPAQGFAPEFLWSYEAGFKSDLLDRRLRVNGTAFRYNYTDLQVQSFLTPGVIDITNASDAKVNGLEFEVLARPTTALEVGGYLAYLDATYKNYPGALKPGNIPFDASGQRLNSSPKWSYNVFGQYTYDLAGGSSLSGRVEYAWKARQFFTPENNLVETQASYGLVNANLTWTSSNRAWQVIAYGRNLGDEAYVTTTATFTGVVSGRVGDPRTYGLRVVYGF